MLEIACAASREAAHDTPKDIIPHDLRQENVVFEHLPSPEILLAALILAVLCAGLLWQTLRLNRLGVNRPMR